MRKICMLLLLFSALFIELAHSETAYDKLKREHLQKLNEPKDATNKKEEPKLPVYPDVVNNIDCMGEHDINFSPEDTLTINNYSRYYNIIT